MWLIRPMSNEHKLTLTLRSYFKTWLSVLLEFHNRHYFSNFVCSYVGWFFIKLFRFSISWLVFFVISSQWVIRVSNHFIFHQFLQTDWVILVRMYDRRCSFVNSVPLLSVAMLNESLLGSRKEAIADSVDCISVVNSCEFGY